MIKLLLLFFSVLVYSQQNHKVKLNMSIKDKSKSTKSLTVIDQRTNSSIGEISTSKKNHILVFPTNNMKDDVENWFLRDNKNSEGEKEIVIIVEKFKVQKNENGISGTIDQKLSSFVKKGNGFYFIDQVNEQKDWKSEGQSPILDLISTKAAFALSEFIESSYTKQPNPRYLTENELMNFEKNLTKNFFEMNLKDGVYEDFLSFVKQKPNDLLTIVKYDSGKPKKAVKRTDGSSNYKIFGYVENGKAYRCTPVGFLEMNKDEKGYYVLSNKLELEPELNNTAAMAGGLIGGITGALIGTVIDATISSENRKKAEHFEVYIDPLSGVYRYSK